MSDEYTWWFGAGPDPEVFMPASSKAEAIELALAQGREDEWYYMTIAEARPMALRNDIFDADRILELFEEKNEEEAGDDELRDMGASQEQKAELQSLLAEAFADWRRRHKIGRAYQLDIGFTETIQVKPPAPSAS